MPKTARKHFDDDLGRARAIVAHAEQSLGNPDANQVLRSDLYRSAWMFAIGAIDAYFCDAYTDLVAATMIAKNRAPHIALPDFFYEIRFPVRAILESYASNDNWRWRMAARKMMERQNVLSLDAIQKLFNPFFREGQRFFRDCLPVWIADPQSKKRLFGVTRTAFAAMPTPDQRQAVKLAVRCWEKRFRELFQRRHDCIHNCDRPRQVPQRLELAGTVRNVIDDVEFLGHRSDQHIEREFRIFLAAIGASADVIRQAGY